MLEYFVDKAIDLHTRKRHKNLQVFWIG